jgi:cobalt/nickel transport system permease protein
MWLDDPRLASGPPGWLERLDARFKLIIALSFVVLVVATPTGAWRFLGAMGLLLAFLIGLAGTSVRKLFYRWASFAFVVGFLALMVAPGLRARAEHGLLAVILTLLAKNSLAFLMMLVLGSVTPWRELLRAMRRLGVPGVLVATLQFMERYLHVLLDELQRMTRARRARSCRRTGILSWRSLSGLVGSLLLRSFDRSERVHWAMLARGWDGTIRTLDD